MEILLDRVGLVMAQLDLRRNAKPRLSRQIPGRKNTKETCLI
jgi:hypothetical protein